VRARIAVFGHDFPGARWRHGRGRRECQEKPGRGCCQGFWLLIFSCPFEAYFPALPTEGAPGKPNVAPAKSRKFKRGVSFDPLAGTQVRFLLARDSALMSEVLGVFVRALFCFQRKTARRLTGR